MSITTVSVSNRPKTLGCKDVYKAYAKELIRQNEGYWGAYHQKISNYYVYRKEGNKVVEVTSYKRFRAIIETWFSSATDYIISGQVLSMGNNVGKIGGRRVERNFKNKQIDWKKTNAMWEAKGERKGHVYHLSDEWCRIGWNKPCKIKNEHFYRFSPAEGNERGEGFKQRFSEANRIDQNLKYRYQYFPYLREE